MGLGRALPLMIDIAHGVAEVHAAKIVICDLKPQNVSFLSVLKAASGSFICPCRPSGRAFWSSQGCQQLA